jgi:hypothetical protein
MSCLMVGDTDSAIGERQGQSRERPSWNRKDSHNEEATKLFCDIKDHDLTGRSGLDVSCHR